MKNDARFKVSKLLDIARFDSVTPALPMLAVIDCGSSADIDIRPVVIIW